MADKDPTFAPPLSALLTGSPVLAAGTSTTQPATIAGYPGDQTKFFAGDGTWPTRSPYLLYDSGYTTTAKLSIDTGANAFSSNFKHLKIIILARSDTGALTANLTAQFNGDTGANYDAQAAWGTAATAAAGETLGQTSYSVGPIPAGTAPANRISTIQVWIPFYGNPYWFKEIVSLVGANWGTTSATQRAEIRSGTWRSTMGINQVKIMPDAGNLEANSRLVIYEEV